jgi:hypothetical protein
LRSSMPASGMTYLAMCTVRIIFQQCMNNRNQRETDTKGPSEPLDDRANQQFYSPASEPTAGCFGWHIPLGTKLSISPATGWIQLCASDAENRVHSAPSVYQAIFSWPMCAGSV